MPTVSDEDLNTGYFSLVDEGLLGSIFYEYYLLSYNSSGVVTI